MGVPISPIVSGMSQAFYLANMLKRQAFDESRIEEMREERRSREEARKFEREDRDFQRQHELITSGALPVTGGMVSERVAAPEGAEMPVWRKARPGQTMRRGTQEWEVRTPREQAQIDFKQKIKDAKAAGQIRVDVDIKGLKALMEIEQDPASLRRMTLEAQDVRQEDQQTFTAEESVKTRVSQDERARKANETRKQIAKRRAKTTSVGAEKAEYEKKLREPYNTLMRWGEGDKKKAKSFLNEEARKNPKSIYGVCFGELHNMIESGGRAPTSGEVLKDITEQSGLSQPVEYRDPASAGAVEKRWAPPKKD